MNVKYLYGYVKLQKTYGMTKEEYEYSFGTVTDEDMQELDTTEYILK